jgi:hypothetical protein
MRPIIRTSLLLAVLVIVATTVGESQSRKTQPSPVTLYTPPLASLTGGSSNFFCSVINVSQAPINVDIESVGGGPPDGLQSCPGLLPAERCYLLYSVGPRAPISCKFTVDGRAEDVRASVNWVDFSGFPTTALRAEAQ